MLYSSNIKRQYICVCVCRSNHKPAILIKTYPTVTTITNETRLPGIPRVRKWLTRRYLCPVPGISIIMAAITMLATCILLQNCRTEKGDVLIFGNPLVGNPMATEHINALVMTSKLG